MSDGTTVCRHPGEAPPSTPARRRCARSGVGATSTRDPMPSFGRECLPRENPTRREPSGNQGDLVNSSRVEDTGDRNRNSRASAEQSQAPRPASSLAESGLRQDVDGSDLGGVPRLSERLAISDIVPPPCRSLFRTGGKASTGPGVYQILSAIPLRRARCEGSRRVAIRWRPPIAV